MCALFQNRLIILPRKKQVNLFHTTVYYLTRIVPKINIPTKRIIFQNVSLIKKSSAPPVVIKLIYHAIAMRAHQPAIRQKNFPQSQRAVCMSIFTIFICTGINTMDSFEQHMHSRRK